MQKLSFVKDYFYACGSNVILAEAKDNVIMSETANSRFGNKRPEYTNIHRGLYDSKSNRLNPDEAKAGIQSRVDPRLHPSVHPLAVKV